MVPSGAGPKRVATVPTVPGHDRRWSPCRVVDEITRAQAKHMRDEMLNDRTLLNRQGRAGGSVIIVTEAFDHDRARLFQLHHIHRQIRYRIGGVRITKQTKPRLHRTRRAVLR